MSTFSLIVCSITLLSFTPASSKTDRLFWLGHVCSVIFSGHLHWKRARVRETGCYPHHKASIQVPRCPSFSRPSACHRGPLTQLREGGHYRPGLSLGQPSATNTRLAVAKQLQAEWSCWRGDNERLPILFKSGWYFAERHWGSNTCKEEARQANCHLREAGKTCLL